MASNFRLKPYADGGTWTRTQLTRTWTWIMRVCQFRHICRPVWDLPLPFALAHLLGTFDSILYMQEKVKYFFNLFFCFFQKPFLPDYMTLGSPRKKVPSAYQPGPLFKCISALLFLHFYSESSEYFSWSNFAKIQKRHCRLCLQCLNFVYFV